MQSETDTAIWTPKNTEKTFISKTQIFLKEREAAYFKGQAELNHPQNSELCLASAFGKSVF